MGDNGIPDDASKRRSVCARSATITCRGKTSTDAARSMRMSRRISDKLRNGGGRDHGGRQHNEPDNAIRSSRGRAYLVALGRRIFDTVDLARAAIDTRHHVRPISNGRQAGAEPHARSEAAAQRAGLAELDTLAKRGWDTASGQQPSILGATSVG